MPSQESQESQKKKIYKIGTRGSLLALTQCNQVRVELERLTGDSFELDVIKTQGDLITNAPLWQLDGKDFFTKELDEALLTGRVDLVVHSYKDLGSVRPLGITLAAVTKRTFAHDILLIKKSTIEAIRDKNEFIIGTSSPRRMVNLEAGLKPFLPNASEDLRVTTKVLRGNVNSRIEKLINDDYDAIVLALPGIERLALTESSRLELAKLLDGLSFMVLPQSVFPSSASQGALGIECLDSRTDNGELWAKLRKMQDENTALEVQRERVAFNKYGGGCHLAVGINVKKIQDYFLHNHHGILENEKVEFSLLEGRELPQLRPSPRVFTGHFPDDQLVLKKEVSADLSGKNHLYVTSKHCMHALKKAPESLWAAGIKSMKDLVNKGFWVNGTADSLGDEEIHLLRSSKAIGLMIDTNATLFVLSNTEATTTLGEVIPCYRREVNTSLTDEFKNKINETEVFYWSSYPQYQMYLEYFPQIKNRYHASGLGKTFNQFKQHNIKTIPFAGMEEFKKWTKI